MATNPTQRTLALLRKEGWNAEVTEKWIPGANIRKDLWGFIDVLAIKGQEILGVQSTSYSNISARVHKIDEHDNVAAVRDAGIAIHVHGWHKKGNRWKVRIVDCS